jgi:hypothetical protein
MDSHFHMHVQFVKPHIFTSGNGFTFSYACYNLLNLTFSPVVMDSHFSYACYNLLNLTFSRVVMDSHFHIDYSCFNLLNLTFSPVVMNSHFHMHVLVC